MSNAFVSTTPDASLAATTTTEGRPVTGGNPANPFPATTTHATAQLVDAMVNARVAAPVAGMEPSSRSQSRRRTAAGGGGGGRRRPPAVRTSLPSARDLLYVLFKHRVKATVVALTILALAFLAAALLPGKYTSEAQLLVRVGREAMPMANVAGGPQMMPVVDVTSMVNSEAQIFRSREIVAETVRRVGAERILSKGTAPGNPIPVDAIDMHQPLTARETLASRLLAERIQVNTEPLSTVIKVNYESNDPNLSQDVVQAYVDSYLDHRSRIYANRSAGEAFTSLSKESEEKLQVIEQQIKQLKDQTGVSDVTTQKSILLNRIATLQATLDTVNADLVSTVSRIRTLEDQLESTPKQIPLSQTKNEAMGVVSTARTDLNKLKADLDQKLTTYLPSSTTIVRLQEQVRAAEQRLAELERAGEAQLIGLNPTWSELDKQLATERTNMEGLDSKMKALAGDLNRAKDGQNLINDVELKMSQLARQQGMVDDELKKVLEGRNFSTIDKAMSKDRVGSVTASQQATLPTRPSSPNRMLMLVFGVFAALVGGAGTALICELFDQTVGRPEDLKRLGFTRIVSIPMLRMGSDALVGPLSPETQALLDLAEHGADEASAAVDRLRPTRYVRSTSRAAHLRFTADASGDAPAADLSPREILHRLREQPVQAGTPTSAAPSAPPAVLDPPSARPTLSPRFLEACHAMLERLVYSPAATGEFPMPRSIAVIGITPGQGVTTLATHLAAALADHLPNGDSERADTGRVLLVDANLAAPSVHRLLDMPNEPGISEWIKQSSDHHSLGDYVRHTSVPKMDVLTAGSASVGHLPGRWSDATALTLGSQHHCIVLDLPNMAHAEATARLAGACDAALLVVAGNDVNREVVRQAVHRLAESGVRMLGVVLNKRTYPIPEKLYRWI